MKALSILARFFGITRERTAPPPNASAHFDFVTYVTDDSNDIITVKWGYYLGYNQHGVSRRVIHVKDIVVDGVSLVAKKGYTWKVEQYGHDDLYPAYCTVDHANKRVHVDFLPFTPFP